MCLATVLILGEEKQVIGKYVSHLRGGRRFLRV